MVILLGHLLNCIMKLIDDIHSIFTKSMEPILGQIWFLGSVEAVAGKIALQSVFFFGVKMLYWVPVFIPLWTVCCVRASVADSFWSTNTKSLPGLFQGDWSSWSFYRHMLEKKFMECRSSWMLAVQIYLGGAVGAGPTRNSWKKRQYQCTVPFYNFFGLEFNLKA